MDQNRRQGHWNSVYASKREDEVSWYEATPTQSLEMISRCGISRTSAIIDIGGGASHLVDSLLAIGFETITVLDLAEAALKSAQERIGAQSEDVTWIVADVTAWRPAHQYDVWHDRAAFHFLTTDADRNAYVTCLTSALKPGGHAIIATFAPDGPDACSGLPIVKYDADTLGGVLGNAFHLLDTIRQRHTTPWGSTQLFQFSRLLYEPA